MMFLCRLQMVVDGRETETDNEIKSLDKPHLLRLCVG